MAKNRTVLNLWKGFSVWQIEQKSLELAGRIKQYQLTEQSKSAAAKQFSEEIAAIREQMNALSREITERGAIFPVECSVEFHTPAIGRKRIIRRDTQEIVEEKAMDPEECQENLFQTTEPVEENQTESQREAHS